MKHLQVIHNEKCLSLQPVKKVEIYSFFDPFCKDCWELKAVLRKLQIEYSQYVEIKQILLPTLRVLTKCQAQSTTEDDNIALAYKAAELQGRKKAGMFLRFVQNEIMPKQDIITRELIMDCAQKARLDIETFQTDIKSVHVTNSLKVDQHISREMEVTMSPTLVFFNENFEDDGLKVEGIQQYAIYTYIINEMISHTIEKELPPKIDEYIIENELVSESELEIIYEWPKNVLSRELKKLKLMNKIEAVTYHTGQYWRKKEAM
ncbi:DsbA family protein [Macrococcus equipercicus]|uniref:DsbA family protein n=1 Tax=Macrococcus equipercicus TaxID=69967 RepID=A0A9Q9F2J2_9STAP|nr:DsbA family protein [Macrococcus equipercicus]UTH14456.1 DsbA family protein [Macrococcus equipercicus]